MTGRKRRFLICLILLMGCSFIGCAKEKKEEVVSEKETDFKETAAGKTETVSEPDKERKKLAGQEGFRRFFLSGIAQFLTEANGQNRVYSPVDVYMALGMLAEITGKESRSQILSFLGVDGMEALHRQEKEIWEGSYREDEIVSCVPAASLWLNKDIGIQFQKDVLDRLEKHCHAFSYQGIVGSEEMNRAMQGWFYEQTGGLFKGQAENLAEDTIMVLAAALNFHARWTEEFSEDMTKKGVFHAQDKDISCDFMHSDGTGYYYGLGSFSAVSKQMGDGSYVMWFVLPEEGISVDDVLKDGKAGEFLLSVSDKETWEKSRYLIIHFAAPRFDIVSDMDLIPGLKKLGINDVFDPGAADISPLTGMAEGNGWNVISQVKHTVRVQMDEKGCAAAANTCVMLEGESMSSEEVDFVLDRPFLFAVTGKDGLPFFVGIVNEP